MQGAPASGARGCAAQPSCPGGGRGEPAGRRLQHGGTRLVCPRQLHGAPRAGHACPQRLSDTASIIHPSRAAPVDGGRRINPATDACAAAATAGGDQDHRSTRTHRRGAISSGIARYSILRADDGSRPLLTVRARRAVAQRRLARPLPVVWYLCRLADDSSLL